MLRPRLLQLSGQGRSANTVSEASKGGRRRQAMVLPPLRRVLAGEMTGTFILVFFGCGAVMSQVISGAQVAERDIAMVGQQSKMSTSLPYWKP